MRPSAIPLACLVMVTAFTLLQTADHGGILTSHNDAHTSRTIACDLPEARTLQTGSTDTAAILFDWNVAPNQIIPWLKKNEPLLNRGDGCTLTVHWASANPKDRNLPSSAVHEIASLVANPEDEQIHTIIRDKVSGSGLDVRVGVQYLPWKSGVSELRIALAFEGLAEDVFGEDSRAEGATIRDQQWKVLKIVKPVRVSEMVYTYTWSCESGKTFLGFLRRPTKAHAPAGANPQ